MKKEERIDKKVKEFLKENPKIKEAMEVFGMSMKEYTSAINALTRQNTILSTNNTNGDLVGNQ